MINELLLAVLVGVHFIVMTIIGDLKDVGGRETSFAELYGRDSIEFMSVLGFFAALQSLIILYLSPHIVLGVVFGFYIFALLYYSTRQESKTAMKKGIVKYEVISVLAFSIILVEMISISSVAVLFTATVVWGLTWQTMLYGDPLYFP